VNKGNKLIIKALRIQKMQKTARNAIFCERFFIISLSVSILSVHACAASRAPLNETLIKAPVGTAVISRRTPKTLRVAGLLQLV